MAQENPIRQQELEQELSDCGKTMGSGLHISQKRVILDSTWKSLRDDGEKMTCRPVQSSRR